MTNPPSADSSRSRRDTSAASLLEVEGLTVHVGGRPIVRGASLVARGGEVVAVVGPNGAGKTTLLEGILGLRPSEGRVSLEGTRLRSFPQRAGAFAYMPDEAALPEEASVDAILRAASRDPSRRERVAEQYEIRPLLQRGARALSRGEAKRVWLAATALLDRPVLVLDEPFGAFDPLQLDALLPALAATLDGRSAALVTIHQMAIAERVADRIVMLAAGRIVATGTLEELRERVGRSDASLEDVFRALLTEEAARVAT